MSISRIMLIGAVLSVMATPSSGQEPLIRIDIWEYPISLSADGIQTWKEDGQPRVFLAEGRFVWTQGALQVAADRGAVWFDEALAAETGEVALDIYTEGRVTIMQENKVERYERVLVRASSSGPGAGLVIRPNPNELERGQQSDFLVRGDALRKRALTDYASKDPVVKPPRAAVPKIEDADVSADATEVGWQDGGRVAIVLRGNVVFQRRDVTLTADNAVLWVRREGEGKAGDAEARRKLEELYAEGNVTLQQGNNSIAATRAYENFLEDRGVYIDARLALLESKPGVYFQAAEVWHTGKGQYEAANGSFTTCEHATPHYDVRAKRVRVLQDAEATVVSAAHNFVRVGGTPVWYWPYIAHDLKDRDLVLRSLRAGNSSDMGTYVETRWNVYDMFGHHSSWSDLDLMLDHYSKRGTGLGLKMDYGGNSMFGTATGYYISDDADEDRPGERVSNSDRGRFLWRHRSYLPSDWRAEVEVSYLSDRNFLREFSEDEFKEGKEQETVLYFRRLKNNKGFTYLQRHRINHFDTTVEQMPKLGYDVIGEPLWRDTVVYTSSTQLADLKRRMDNSLRVPNPERTWRFHTSHEFALPFKLWMARLSPFYRAQLTAANTGRAGSLPRPQKRHRSSRRSTGSAAQRTADRRTEELAVIGRKDSGSVYRLANTVGLNASADFWRIYNVHSKLLDVNRLRHIMTPEFQWELTPSVTNGPKEFNQFDEVDRIDEFHRFMFGFRNRFQTKRGRPGHERTVDLMTFDLEYSIYPGSSGRNREFDDLVEVDFTYLIRDWLTYESTGNEFNFGTGSWEVISNGLKIEPTDRWSIYLGHTYLHRTNSVITFDLEHVINERWTVRFYEQYDFDSQVDRNRGRQNLDTTLVLRRRLHKWVMDLSFEVDEGESDTRVSLAFAHVGSERRLRRY